MATNRAGTRRRGGSASAAFALAACAWLGGCASGGPNLATQSTGTADAGRIAAAAGGEQATRPGRQTAERKAATKVALLLPLTGPGQASLVAESMKKAADLAIVDANAAHIQLMMRDDKGTPEGAEAAARDAIGNGAEIIIGPLFAKSVSAAAGPARQGRVPIVAFSNDRTVAGPGVHLLSFLPGPEVERVVRFAAGKGRKRIAALVPEDAYGKLMEQTLREHAARNGAEVVAVESYSPEANRMLERVRKLRDAVRGIEEHGEPVDALFVAAGEELMATLAPQLKIAEFDMTRIKLIGTGALDYPGAGRDPVLAGAWYAAPDPKGWQEFAERYARSYTLAPPRIASLAYDAMTLAVTLSGGPEGARFIPSQLTRATGFNGVDGAYRLLPDGSTERALVVMEVQKNGAVIIDGAATGAPGEGPPRSTMLEQPQPKGQRLN